MVVLGTLGDEYSNMSEASDLHSRGEEVGYADLDPGLSLSLSHAFLWTQAGGMIDLGTLAAPTATRSTAAKWSERARPSYAYRINESGQVVGTSTNVAGQHRATLWVPAGGGGLPGG
jgi:probable HAF family extracellular repeat protein